MSNPPHRSPQRTYSSRCLIWRQTTGLLSSLPYIARFVQRPSQKRFWEGGRRGAFLRNRIPRKFSGSVGSLWSHCLRPWHRDRTRGLESSLAPCLALRGGLCNMVESLGPPSKLGGVGAVWKVKLLNQVSGEQREGVWLCVSVCGYCVIYLFLYIHTHPHHSLTVIYLYIYSI